MHKVEDLDFYQDSFSALKTIQEKGFTLFIITNQSGIGRGYFKEKDMHMFHAAMLKKFSSRGIEFCEIKFCPHSPDDGCDCRKPSPKLVLECIDKYDIDTRSSWMIGDKIIDAECGKRAGVNGVTIGTKIYSDKESSFRNFKSLTEFAQYI